MVKKTKRHPLNPFIISGYEGPGYFCNRTEETENIVSHLQNGINITLVSPRKIGKTGLIKHVFHRIKELNKDAICIYIDIFHTQNQHDFIQTLGRAVVQEKLLDQRSPVKKKLSTFSNWRPTFSFDPMTGAPVISVNIDHLNTEHTIEGILTYLNSSNQEVFIAIDEFQTITDYPEKGTEALLRSHIQFMNNVHFIFSGSKQHLMYEMFGSPKRPFYQSTSMMNLEPLHEEIYYDFAARFFTAKKGSISPDVFSQLYKMFEGHTWYMQSVLNRLYERGKHVTDFQQVNETILTILAEKAPQYESLMGFLTTNQFSVLKAIAQEGFVAQPQSNAFIQKYELASASSNKKVIDVLTEKELIYRTPQGYIVYDRFLALWLKRQFL